MTLSNKVNVNLAEWVSIFYKNRKSIEFFLRNKDLIGSENKNKETKSNQSPKYRDQVTN